jgi:site-specific DNA-methyltransferase (adenine-specific)
MSTQASFALRGRNPDVLTCIANLSNDEVFTPPELANRMLDTLAEVWGAANGGADIWADKTVRFLDPCTKSGVFLREVTIRLTNGLAHAIPDLEQRVNHILTNQVFGIGITNLTSLLTRRSVYCSKHARGEHSIAKSFSSDDGNISFERIKHTWAGNKCKWCGAGRSVFDRAEGLETHAYAFIHTDRIKARLAEIFGGDMQFDVIIGNPPYQLASDGGTRDVPIYQHFVEQAKRLEPRFLSMVIPSRWMASGLGLSDFRQAVLSDRRMRELVDYPAANDVFPGVEVKAGVCYFLWDATHDGECKVTTIRGGEAVGPVQRDLGEYDVFVRDARAVSILHKVSERGEASINTILARDKEFGWTSNFDGFHERERSGDVPLYYIRKMKRGVGFIGRRAVTKSTEMVDTWKVLVPQAFNGGDAVPHQILGKPLIAPSPSVCTQSFLFFNVGSFKAAKSLQSYYTTRLFRFLYPYRIPMFP